MKDQEPYRSISLAYIDLFSGIDETITVDIKGKIRSNAVAFMKVYLDFPFFLDNIKNSLLYQECIPIGNLYTENIENAYSDLQALQELNSTSILRNSTKFVFTFLSKYIAFCFYWKNMDKNRKDSDSLSTPDYTEHINFLDPSTLLPPAANTPFDVSLDQIYFPMQPYSPNTEVYVNTSLGNETADITPHTEQIYLEPPVKEAIQQGLFDKFSHFIKEKLENNPKLSLYPNKQKLINEFSEGLGNEEKKKCQVLKSDHSYRTIVSKAQVDLQKKSSPFTWRHSLISKARQKHKKKSHT